MNEEMEIVRLDADVRYLTSVVERLQMELKRLKECVDGIGSDMELSKRHICSDCKRNESRMGKNYVWRRR